jgi:predicted RNA binding protein YcfA (HicA-like mRNA interferase family)
MSKLPRVSGRECVRRLARAGFVVKRQHGSHIVLRRNDPFAQVVILDHPELDRGTLRAILRQAGLSVDEFPCHGVTSDQRLRNCPPWGQT